MKPPGGWLALFAPGFLGLGALARVAARPLVPVALAGPSGNTTAVDRRAAVTEPSQDSVSAIVSRNPFRISRRPVIPAYDPLRLAEQQAPPPPRPSLVLVGIVSGEMPLAVVEGLRGGEGARGVRMGATC